MPVVSVFAALIYYLNKSSFPNRFMLCPHTLFIEPKKGRGCILYNRGLF